VREARVPANVVNTQSFFCHSDVDVGSVFFVVAFLDIGVLVKTAISYRC
jgi:hypothetical protein